MLGVMCHKGDRETMKMKILVILALSLFSGSSWALQVKDLYTIDVNNRTWYLGGIYDANIIQWNDEGQRSNCIEKLGLNGFIAKLSEFIVALPEDQNSKERRVYDEMNVATLAWLILDKECVK